MTRVLRISSWLVPAMLAALTYLGLLGAAGLALGVVLGYALGVAPRSPAAVRPAGQQVPASVPGDRAPIRG